MHQYTETCICILGLRSQPWGFFSRYQLGPCNVAKFQFFPLFLPSIFLLLWLFFFFIIFFFFKGFFQAHFRAYEKSIFVDSQKLDQLQIKFRYQLTNVFYFFLFFFIEKSGREKNKEFPHILFVEKRILFIIIGFFFGSYIFLVFLFACK